MVRYYPCAEIEREYCGNTYIEHLSTYDSLFTRNEAFKVIKEWYTQFKIVRSFIQKYTDDDNDPEVEEISLNSLSCVCG